MSYITEQNQPPGWYPESTGEGGSLPTSITKIDGGSFTFNANRSIGIRIAHNLGVIPKGYAVWTEDEISSATNISYVGEFSTIVSNIHRDNSTNVIGCGYVTFSQAGTPHTIQRYIGAEEIVDYMDEEDIRFKHDTIYYKTGVTYKWIAWA